MDGEARAADPEAPLEQGMAAGMQELLTDLLPCSTGDPPAVFYAEIFSPKRRGFSLRHNGEKKLVVEGMGHGLSSLPQCL